MRSPIVALALWWYITCLNIVIMNLREKGQCQKDHTTHMCELDTLLGYVHTLRGFDLRNWRDRYKIEGGRLE